MSTLRQQILDRINETPHRPPTLQDILRRQFPLAREVIAAELEAMIADREIDTETGTDGLTYRKAKPPYVPAEKAYVATVCTDAGIAYFPGKNQQPRMPISPVQKTEAIKQRAAEPPKAMPKKALIEVSKKPRGTKPVCAKNRATIAQHLTFPMSAAEFAVCAKIEPDMANAILNRAELQKQIGGDNKGRPKIFYPLSLAGENIAALAAEARPRAAKHKRATFIRRRKYDVAAMAAEYANGDLVLDIARRHCCHLSKVRECVALAGVKPRTRAEINAAVARERIAKYGPKPPRVRTTNKGKRINITDEHRKKLADQMRINRQYRHKRVDAFAGGAA